jgi:hypothetical protein
MRKPSRQIEKPVDAKWWAIFIIGAILIFAAVSPGLERHYHGRVHVLADNPEVSRHHEDARLCAGSARRAPRRATEVFLGN